MLWGRNLPKWWQKDVGGLPLPFTSITTYLLFLSPSRQSGRPYGGGAKSLAQNKMCHNAEHMQAMAFSEHPRVCGHPCRETNTRRTRIGGHGQKRQSRRKGWGETHSREQIPQRCVNDADSKKLPVLGRWQVFLKRKRKKRRQREKEIDLSFCSDTYYICVTQTATDSAPSDRSGHHSSAAELWQQRDVDEWTVRPSQWRRVLLENWYIYLSRSFVSVPHNLLAHTSSWNTHQTANQLISVLPTRNNILPGQWFLVCLSIYSRDDLFVHNFILYSLCHAPSATALRCGRISLECTETAVIVHRWWSGTFPWRCQTW